MSLDQYSKENFESYVWIHFVATDNYVIGVNGVSWCSQVSHFASVLQSRGVVKGDRVIIYMPMIPEAIVAMLACARIGAIHSLVFGGFASKELATRINHAKVVYTRISDTLIWPRVIVSQLTYPYHLPLSKTTRCGRDLYIYCTCKK